MGIHQPSSKVGVDTGGTFTDFVWLDGEGRIRVHKEVSTPADPAQAILGGISYLGVAGDAAVIHGSTVATNALLERRGARTALIATKGFGDVLAIGRQERPELYALVPRRPEPLVPDRWRFEVAERVTADGSVQEAPDEADLARVVDSLVDESIESVAVCLLFSFLYPGHERRIAEAITRRAAAGQQKAIHVSLSSEILPEYREYERTATTVINAYVAPLMAGYLGRLEDEIKPRTLAVMQSNGGIISAARAGREAARTVLSGPAGGVVGAMHVAQLAGINEIITFDMGGTSTDVALCPGRLPATTEGEIAGLPLRLPIIDIHTVGAGGGSLASVDPGGALQVGPRSAGAAPGPACYGERVADWPATDAERTTVTDANLALGRLDANHFLGGTITLDEAAAQRVMSGLSAAIGADSAEQAAWGVIQVANANIERAMRRISVERGYDPRMFTLVAFGGAGPLHACELAVEMGIPQVLVPPSPGVLSALGMLVARPTRDYSLTVMGQLEPGEATAEWLVQRFAALTAQAEADMGAEGYVREAIRLVERLDMRYEGQSHELTVAIQPGESQEALAAAFHRAHGERYGFSWPEKIVQIVNLRLTAEVQEARPQLPKIKPGGEESRQALVGHKPVWFGAREVDCHLYDRRRLLAGNRFRGPAIVFQYDTTTVVPPQWEVVVDDYGNLLLSGSA